MPASTPAASHRHSGGAGSRVLRPLVRIVATIVSAGLLVTAGVVFYQYRSIDNGVERFDLDLGAPRPSGSAAATSAAPDIDGRDQNILVVGNDDRSDLTDAEVKDLRVGRGQGSLATDTMMIVHVPADGSRATLISLPRDTIVDIPDGYRRNLLNSPYASAYVDALEAGKSKKEARKAGANLLIKTVRNLTGLSFDHYIQVDLFGFYLLSKAIGGVPVTLCRDVDDRHSTNRARGEDGGSGLHLSAGKHYIEGKDALSFVRQRHGLPGGDLDRVKRQQYFLTAAFRQIASVGVITKLGSLGDALHRSVYFDKKLKLIDLARQLQNLTANNIVGKTIPLLSDGSADPRAVKKFVAKVIDGGGAKTAKKPTSAAAAKPKATTAIDGKCIN